ncbi:hypothetical protein SDC9_101466 [bioreactor metagenome]|uniref:Uncharacterized protein n=1 Tax=bioreactor metagenome TaxID=1076179 RepID=A0A645ANR9_9ZZZZ
MPAQQCFVVIPHGEKTAAVYLRLRRQDYRHRAGVFFTVKRFARSGVFDRDLHVVYAGIAPAVGVDVAEGMVAYQRRGP